jgi:hypothetical protein
MVQSSGTKVCRASVEPAAARTVLHLLEAAPQRLEFRTTHGQVSGARFVSPRVGPISQFGLHLSRLGEPVAELCVRSNFIRFFERSFESSRGAETEWRAVDGLLARPITLSQDVFLDKTAYDF